MPKPVQPTTLEDIERALRAVPRPAIKPVDPTQAQRKREELQRSFAEVETLLKGGRKTGQD